MPYFSLDPNFLQYNNRAALQYSRICHELINRSTVWDNNSFETRFVLSKLRVYYHFHWHVNRETIIQILLLSLAVIAAKQIFTRGVNEKMTWKIGITSKRNYVNVYKKHRRVLNFKYQRISPPALWIPNGNREKRQKFRNYQFLKKFLARNCVTSCMARRNNLICIGEILKKNCVSSIVQKNLKILKFWGNVYMIFGNKSGNRSPNWVFLGK